MATEKKIVEFSGDKEGFEVVKIDTAFSTKFEVRKADTGQRIESIRSRKDAIEKAQKLAEKH